MSPKRLADFGFFSCCVALVSVCMAFASVGAFAKHDGEREKRSVSFGFPWHGKLSHGWKIRPSNYLRYTGEYAKDGNFYGTWELVQLLERAAIRVEARVPGAKLSVGELSKASGGRIAGHRSHENGRDVDISFYMQNAQGEVFEPWAFANFGRNGKGRGANTALRFDDARNWELVAKLVADGDARVQHIFVSSGIQARLLAEARRRGAPSVLIERAKKVMMQPSHGHPHRNHFHVRIYCPPSDRSVCKDKAPYWSWYPGSPPAAFASSRIATLHR
ncbi:MAG: penicillin-insensitive murein endopeptidase [Myxococcales bacterium]|nr:MAG: penicillin-insensitive murein endopeptidase [Myxococcales bacterium]